MVIRYTAHARDRMRLRSVTEADVERALRESTDSLVTPLASVRYKGPGMDGRTLKVWVVQRALPQTYVVKSVAWKGESDA
jgi:hypothetical protein